MIKVKRNIKLPSAYDNYKINFITKKKLKKDVHIPPIVHLGSSLTPVGSHSSIPIGTAESSSILIGTAESSSNPIGTAESSSIPIGNAESSSNPIGTIAIGCGDTFTMESLVPKSRKEINAIARSLGISINGKKSKVMKDILAPQLAQCFVPRKKMSPKEQIMSTTVAEKKKQLPIDLLPEIHGDNKRSLDIDLLLRLRVESDTKPIQNGSGTKPIQNGSDTKPIENGSEKVSTKDSTSNGGDKLFTKRGKLHILNVSPTSPTKNLMKLQEQARNDDFINFTQDLARYRENLQLLSKSQRINLLNFLTMSDKIIRLHLYAKPGVHVKQITNLVVGFVYSPFLFVQFLMEQSTCNPTKVTRKYCRNGRSDSKIQLLEHLFIEYQEETGFPILDSEKWHCKVETKGGVMMETKFTRVTFNVNLFTGQISFSGSFYQHALSCSTNDKGQIVVKNRFAR